ncbi:Repetin OS=Streptomyces glaucescens OX=1907 GN=SGLAU_05860 PE=4 SV=1 [Streptomyces glaucescens]
MAVVSGVITDSDLPGAEGKRVGVTVHDLGRHDRLGYSWAIPPAARHRCRRTCRSASARLPSREVRKGTGDFTVVPWQPRL